MAVNTIFAQYLSSASRISSTSLFEELTGTSPFLLGEEVAETDALTNSDDYLDDLLSLMEENENCRSIHKSTQTLIRRQSIK
jgi:hypothetical protein